MKPILRKILVRGGAAIAVAATALTITTLVRERRTFAAPHPDVHASRDPAVIARGGYLVRGAAHCADCHGAPDQRAALEAGADVPLSGGYEFHLPVGVFRVPNITPDAATGIGRYSDPELARMLRHGVRPDGRMVLPFMPFANLSDDDLTAVISYLRTQPAVKHAVAPHQPNVLGHLVMAFVMSPKGPSQPIVKTVPSAPTVENGRYLANSVGNCVMCHSRVDMRTGEIIGAPFAGGGVHEAVGERGKTFISPNLTPHPRWGWIESWPEEVFIARIHMGKQREGSPMPWHGIRRLADDDLRAIYRYLRTLPPAEGGPDPAQRSSVESSALSLR
jgi:mono/diheme cytochrome c family protein